MNTVVGPLIKLLVEAIRPILEWGIEFAGELLMGALADIFYELLVNLLKLVSFFSSAFFAFAGINNIALRTASGGFAQSNTFLLQYLMDNSGITKMYWILTILSAALCLVFTGISILRSINGTDFDPKHSVGRIWGRLGKTMLTFLLIPVMMLAAIDLSTIVAGRLVENVFEAGQTSVDNVIFLAVTMDAANDERYNGNKASFTDTVRGPYFRGEKAYDANRPEQSVLSKSNRMVTDDFDLKKMDYITGYILCIAMILVLFGAALFAVRRLLEVMLLYIAAPFFVAVIPLDEGKKFEAWRDMFVAKLVSCYGLVLMMMMYLTIVPTIMGAGLKLSEDGLVDSLMKLLLLVGGAFAIKNGHSFVLGIISPQAAQHAQSSTLGGIAMAMGAGTVAGNLLRGALSKGGAGNQLRGALNKGGGQSRSQQPEVQHASAADAQKFSG
jgi:hypothetical protein